MSRSYHSNRTWRYLLQQGGLGPDDMDGIWAKREVKKRVLEQRVVRRDPTARSPVSGIQIEVADASTGLLFPTSDAEIRGVLSCIQGPELEGARSITLALGMGHQDRYLAETEPDSVGEVAYDPIFGRPGRLLTDGLYFPLVGGTYASHAAAVELYGYVVTPEFELDPMWEFALKVQFVKTLLHEMAHHHQYRTATLQGRVVSQLHERFEAKAEEISEAWIRGPVRKVFQDWARALPEADG